MEMIGESEGASCTSSGIKDDLFQFPCLFNHSFLDTLSHPRLESFLRENDSYAAEEEQQEPQIDHDDSHTNTAHHTANLSVLYLWLLGRQNEAEERAQRQLQARPNDVISLSSLTYIWLSQGDHAGAQELLGRLVALREGDPHLYSQHLQAAKETLIRLYNRCMNVVPPFVLSNLLEKILKEDSGNYVVKYNLARMLKCFSQPLYITRYPGVDFTAAIRRSMELLFELKNAETVAVPAETRAMAATELGDIVAWRSNRSHRDVVDQEMKKHKIKDANECFEEALRICPNKPGILIRIGKAIRYYDLEKSKELLEKAVTLVPDSSRAHHYLAVTLRSLVVENRKKKPGQRPRRSGNFRESQPNWNRKENSREVMLHKKKEYWLSRNEKHVNEMIEQFKMALEYITTSPEFPLRLSLAQAYVSLEEYEEAFEQLSITVDTFSTPGVLKRALDDAYVIYIKEALRVRNDERPHRVTHNASESTLPLSSGGQCLRNVAVIVGCQLLQELKINSSSSQDNGDLYNLTSLSKMVSRNDFETTPNHRKIGSPESHFVECLIDCAQQQPLKAMIGDGPPRTKRGLSGAKRGLDSDMDRLEETSRNSYKEGCFDDAAMLLSLRRLLVEMNGKPQVEQGTGAEISSPDSPDVLLVKSCVQAASPRLQEGYAKHDFDYLFQRSLAKFFFKLAFERALAARQVDQTPEQPPEDAKEVLASRNTEEVEEEEEQEEEQEEEHNSQQHSFTGYQVLILTERNARNEDQEPEKDVQYILGDVCGLTVTIDLTEESAGHHHLTQAVDKAQIVLIVVGDAAMSPEFSAAVSAALPAPGASSGDRFVTMLLDGTSLPSCLQGHRWFPWQQERLALAKDSSGSKESASAACQLFANVLGVDVELRD